MEHHTPLEIFMNARPLSITWDCRLSLRKTFHLYLPIWPSNPSRLLQWSGPRSVRDTRRTFLPLSAPTHPDLPLEAPMSSWSDPFFLFHADTRDIRWCFPVSVGGALPFLVPEGPISRTLAFLAAYEVLVCFYFYFYQDMVSVWDNVSFEGTGPVPQILLTVMLLHTPMVCGHGLLKVFFTFRLSNNFVFIFFLSFLSSHFFTCFCFCTRLLSVHSLCF